MESCPGVVLVMLPWRSREAEWRFVHRQGGPSADVKAGEPPRGAISWVEVAWGGRASGAQRETSPAALLPCAGASKGAEAKPRGLEREEDAKGVWSQEKKWFQGATVPSAAE